MLRLLVEVGTVFGILKYRGIGISEFIFRTKLTNWVKTLILL